MVVCADAGRRTGRTIAACVHAFYIVQHMSYMLRHDMYTDRNKTHGHTDTQTDRPSDRQPATQTSRQMLSQRRTHRAIHRN